jgi:prepilin-type N-terminal cleavage/methylation domain-containing protein
LRFGIRVGLEALADMTVHEKITKTHLYQVRNNAAQRRSNGFTLIEMIGVLAVIAVLAAVLIPKVFEAISSARISSVAASCNTVKTALSDHYAKWGSLSVNASGGTSIPITPAQQLAYDRVLLAESFLDKPFEAKIGDGVFTRVEMVTVSGQANTVAPTATDPAAAAASAATDAAFDLDGSGTANGGVVNDTTGSAVVMAVISGVTLEDAKALNRLIDGTSPALGDNGNAAPATDLKGRVKYTVGAGPTTTVYIYLDHR